MTRPKNTQPPNTRSSWLRLRAAPAHRIHAAHRQENPQKNKAQIKNQVRSIHHPARKIVVVPEHRQILQPRRPRRGPRTEIDDPQQQDGPERQDRRDQLALGKRREKRSQRQQRATQQQRAEIGVAQHPPRRGRLAVRKHVDEIRRGGKQHDHQQRQRSKKLPQNDFGIRYGRGHQQFHRAAFALLGIHPHRQHGRQEQQQRRQNTKKVPHHQRRHVNSRRPPELQRLFSGLERFLDQHDQQAVKKIRAQDQKHAHDHVGHRRYKVMAHFLAIYRVKTFHSRSLV